MRNLDNGNGQIIRKEARLHGMLPFAPGIRPIPRPGWQWQIHRLRDSLPVIAGTASAVGPALVQLLRIPAEDDRLALSA